MSIQLNQLISSDALNIIAKFMPLKDVISARQSCKDFKAALPVAVLADRYIRRHQCLLPEQLFQLSTIQNPAFKSANIRSMRLIGRVSPVEIERLKKHFPHLNTLYCTKGCTLDEEGLQAIHEHLPSLVKLSLSRCKLPTGSLGPLSDFHSLRVLDISSIVATASDLQHIPTSVEHLNISDNPNITKLEGLADKTSLKTLDASNIEYLSDIQAIPHSVEHLNISLSTNIGDFSPLQNTNLQTLGIEGFHLGYITRTLPTQHFPTSLKTLLALPMPLDRAAIETRFPEMETCQEGSVPFNYEFNSPSQNPHLKIFKDPFK